MVRLNLEGIWIDLNDQEFELKWKHPIQNSLKGENSTYSTDITCALTENNRLAFDYKIFTSSSKTNRYLYGVLYVNNTAMRVRCYIKGFSLTSVKFYLEQFRQGAVSNLLKDETNICDLYLPEIQNQSRRDVFINVETGEKAVDTTSALQQLPDLFTARSSEYIGADGLVKLRPNISAEGLIQSLSLFYGVALNNAPTNYLAYSNRWLIRSGIFAASTNVNKTFTGSGSAVLDYPPPTPKNIIWIDGNKLVSIAPFRVDLNILNLVSSGNVEFGYISKNEANETVATVILGTASNGNLFLKTPILVPGTCTIFINRTASAAFTTNVRLRTDFTTLEIANPSFGEYPKFGEKGYYPCWQNLPPVTAKTLIETIALCAGKMVEYKDNSIDFVDFDQVFDWKNAIDVSDKLISMKEKSFRFLDSNNATVSYSSGAIIATVLINDETLLIGTNNVATIDALRIQDDTGEERTTDKVVLQQTPDGHFEIINKLADIYTPVINPKVFEADFIYFADNKKPLLIRQFGGIFIALESVMTTKNTITLKLLKLR